MEFLSVFESMSNVLRRLLWVWKKFRMLLPFREERKAVWNLANNLKAIEFAIEETDPQHFEQEIRHLYPKIGRYGLQVPLLDPVRIGNGEYDGTWYRYHLTFLKVLRRWIRNEEVDVPQWNVDVMRENEKRQNFVAEWQRRDEAKSVK